MQRWRVGVEFVSGMAAAYALIGLISHTLGYDGDPAMQRLYAWVVLGAGAVFAWMRALR